MNNSRGSVRIDIVGGTLDLWPLSQIIEGAVTLNMAIELEAEVVLHKTDKDGIDIISEDYQRPAFFSSAEMSRYPLCKEAFGSLIFVGMILQYFKLTSGLSVRLKSGSPPGAGLGGSSAMGVTLFKALLEYTHQRMENEKIIEIVSDIEAVVLNKGPTGFQDYYPALYGGVLALQSRFGGVSVEQLYCPELAAFLEQNVSLIYSGQTRLSGINNWEVYKSFFDGDPKIQNGLKKIAEISQAAWNSIRIKDYQLLLDLIGQEGEERSKLFKNIMTPEMTEFYSKARSMKIGRGVKVCGAGGGGCFLLIHGPGHQEQVLTLAAGHNMQVLPFKVKGPLAP